MQINSKGCLFCQHKILKCQTPTVYLIYFIVPFDLILDDLVYNFLVFLASMRFTEELGQLYPAEDNARTRENLLFLYI